MNNKDYLLDRDDIDDDRRLATGLAAFGDGLLGGDGLAADNGDLTALEDGRLDSLTRGTAGDADLKGTVHEFFKTLQ